MSTEDDRERELDERLRRLTRRVAEAAPPPIAFEDLAERARARHPLRTPLVVVGALVTALVLVVAVVATRDRETPTVTSSTGEPIALEPQGTTTVQVGAATLPAALFRLPDDRELAVLANPTELCARIDAGAPPTCSPEDETNIRYVLVGDGDSVVVVTVVPAGSALAVITVGGAPYTQQPVGGVVAFRAATPATRFTIVAYDAAGRQTGTISGP